MTKRTTTTTGTRAALAVIAMAISGATAHAQTTYYVDPAGAGAACTQPSPCPLIATALGLAINGDTVSVAAGTYAEAGLAITADVTIRGANAFTTTIDATGLGARIFTVNATNVVIDRMTLANASIAFANGGAIELTSGNLTVSRSRLLDNNAAPGGAGGAIAASGLSTAVNLVSTVVEGNNAGFDGGAVWCDGCLGVTLLLSRVIENTAGGTGGAIWIEESNALVSSFSYLSRNSAGQGGAINAAAVDVHLLDSELADNAATNGDGGAVFIAGNLNIERSTLAGNTASLDSGGAVYFLNAGAFVANIFASANSTYSGNTALCGGGLFFDANFGAGGDVKIGTSTFAGNVSNFAGCADHIIDGANTIELYNSIVSGSSGNPACGAPLTGGTHNLLVDASCDTGVALFNLGAVTGLNAALAYNGGLTRTHMITAVSNAVNAGRNAACVNPWASWWGPLVPLVIDQRGAPRARTVANPCDIGSVERP